MDHDYKLIMNVLDMHTQQLAGELLPTLQWANPNSIVRKTDAYFYEDLDLISACVGLIPTGDPEEDVINLYISVSFADMPLNQAALEIQLARPEGEQIDEWPPAGIAFQTVDELGASLNALLAVCQPDLVRAVECITALMLEPRFALY